MQIVIDMSEEEYNRIKENDCGLFNGRFFQMIRDGIPLPKGHGRLIDADAVLEEPIGDTYIDLDITEVIIDADTTESENTEI